MASLSRLCLVALISVVAVPLHAEAGRRGGGHHRAHGGHHRAGHHSTHRAHRRGTIHRQTPHHWAYHRTPMYGYAGCYGPPGATVMVVAPRRSRFAIGGYLSSVGSATDRGDGVGAAIRWRGDRTHLELELGATSYAATERRDQRVGGNLYVDLRDPDVLLQPYLVVGVGLRQRSDDRTSSAYASAGVGLGVAISDSLTLFGDLRWSKHGTPIDDQAPASARVAATEPAGRAPPEARLGVLFAF